MGELSQHTIAKVSGPAWDQIRGQFMQVARSLLAVSPDAHSGLLHDLRQVHRPYRFPEPCLCCDLAEEQQAADRWFVLARGLPG